VGDSADHELIRSGPPVPVCDIRIVDPTTRRPVSIGETGLLLVRGPQVMKCYYGDPGEASSSDFDNRLDTSTRCSSVVRGTGK
jgi:long-subunit acyl-CoA synthetase (AMP-forming)